MQPEFIQIYWTCGSLDEARQTSRYLVEEKLVACANIIPWIESIFLWDEQVDTSQETKVIFKTQYALFDAVKEAILKRSKYEVPEILMVPILGGNQEYLDWLAQNTPTMR
ncbi:MAG: Divalent-cation tolerance protein CutA [Chlamydiales bacterium]|nr:Divalent-cation tolerance protein CutA [Chlamydiales bacterium]